MSLLENIGTVSLRLLEITFVLEKGRTGVLGVLGAPGVLRNGKGLVLGRHVRLIVLISFHGFGAW